MKKKNHFIPAYKVEKQANLIENLFFFFWLKKRHKILLSSYFYEIGISYDKTQFTFLLSVIVFHMVRITCLLSAFRKDKYEGNLNSQS